MCRLRSNCRPPILRNLAPVVAVPAVIECGRIELNYHYSVHDSQTFKDRPNLCPKIQAIHKASIRVLFSYSLILFTSALLFHGMSPFEQLEF